MRKKYSRLAALNSIVTTVFLAQRDLARSRLGGLRPFFLVLMFLALLLSVLYAVSPFAPFVYSLF